MKKAIVIAVSLLSLFSIAAGAAEESIYRKVREARPDGRTIKVRNLVLQRDVYRLTFRSGTFHLLAPFAGRTFGAVFIGDGSFLLDPATRNERKQLALVLGDPATETLTDTFDTLVLLFSDETAKDIEKNSAIEHGSADPRATSVYTDYLEKQKKRYRMNLHLRILMDLLQQPVSGSGVFLAAVDGKKLAPALIAVDPLGIGNLAAGFGFFGGEQTAFLSLDDTNGGLWYLSALKGEAVEGRGKPLPVIVDALRYDIDTTIASNLNITGTTTIHLRPQAAGIRVVPIHILPKLRLKDASIRVDGRSQSLEIIQEEADLGKLARMFRDEVADSNAAVVAETPLRTDADAEITLHYEGRDVLQAIGVDSFSVQARESWYPNVGTFTDVAEYSLTYHFPKGNSLVSSGRLIKEETVDKQQTSRWESSKPMRVAGFNYGKFEKISEKDAPSGLELEVYTNRDQRKMARDTMADAQNAARTATAFFGPAPYPNVAVTQQAEWNFGQSWPSLVYLPTLALTTSTERVAMLDEAAPTAISGANDFAKTVGWHEMSHQWWGHLVGWESYRDQWLSEGFAEFTAALVLQFTENFQKYDDFWERKRQTILERRGGTVANNDSGAISQGFRVATRNSPSAGQAIVYDKGAYVLHMLRMMLRDVSAKNPDEKFMTMMKDFVTTYGGKNPSTADFQRVVERHMTAPMNATNDGSMAYFFRQWVDGTSVPKFRSDVRLDPIDGGKSRLSGSVSQEGVPEDFISVVPLYIEFQKGEIARFGAIRLVGTKPQQIQGDLPLPSKPKRVVVNALHDVLAR